MAKKVINKPIEEQLNDIRHLLQVLIKGQQDIKGHIWLESGEEKIKEPKHYKGQKELIFQEQEAVKYIHNVLIPDLAKKEAEKGEMVAEGVWVEWAAKPFIEYFKTQALIWIGKALNELKGQLIPLAVNVADFILEQLENILVNQYNKASEEDKARFKEIISEKFPNSRLLEKLN